MDWNAYLEPGEQLRWEGCPAPRSFVFRNWKHSLFGLFLLIVAGFWEAMAIGLADTHQSPWMYWLPVPFIVGGLYLAIGHLLLARIEWDRVGYAATDRRLLACKGLFSSRLETFKLSDLAYFKVTPLGKQLATIQARSADRKQKLTLTGVESPESVISVLETALRDNGHEVAVRHLA